jgi:hypothetical protein
LKQIDQTSPAQSEWAALYQAADAFKALAPWTWMYDSDLFGVQNPEDGQIGYCCVMGILGEHFALGVYLGTAGLAGYLRLQSGELGMNPDPLAVMFAQQCLMASFEDRAYLEKRDLSIIKDLGLKYRGRNAWPQFRSYEPGYLPWYLTAAEARFLTTALEQTIDVAQRFRDNPDLLTPPHPGQYLVRVPAAAPGGVIWSDHYLAPAAMLHPIAVAPKIDEARVRRIKQTIKRRQGIWEADLFPAPTPIQEQKDQRPYYPYMALLVDHRTGMMLPPHLANHQSYRAEFQGHLLSLFEQMGFLPKEIRVLTQEVVGLLEPLTDLLGIKLQRVKRLDMLEEARVSMMEYFSNF